MIKLSFLILSLGVIAFPVKNYVTHQNQSEISGYKNNFIKKELETVIKLAEKGNPEAQNKIGCMTRE